jgi:putative membrane protein
MVKDHSQADDQLKGVAQSQHVSLPTSLDPKHKDVKERLSKLTGSKFDQAYMTLMVQEHTKAINQYQQEAQNGHDPTVKGFAKQSVPLLKSHLKEAKAVAGKLTKS